jgi:ribosomal protein L11 methyltransferase
MTKHPVRLETVAVSVTEDLLEAFEAALANACPTVGFFCDHDTGIWQVEGVKQIGVNDAELASSLAVAAMMTGVSPVLCRSAIEADGWLARTYASFPEQLIGTRFAVRGTHLTGSKAANRITLALDAGLAFGSGEHGSTRGCLVALEAVARRQPRRILDMGTGSGILAMAAAMVTNRPVLATDIEPWAVRVAEENAKLNRVAHLVSVRLADGWRDPVVRAHGPYDLVFANILARPLCLIARDLALNLAPSGTAILAGLLACQARWVLSAHLAQGLRLERMLSQGLWTTIVIRKPPSAPISKSRSPLRLGRGGVSSMPGP